METKLKKWVLEITSKTNAWENLDDFHIDELSSIKTKITKNDWIREGLNSYREVNEFLKKNKLNYYCELSIKLSYSKIKTGISFRNLKELNTELSSSPPSLYIFSKDYYSKLEIIKKQSFRMDENFFGEKNAYYTEVFDESEEEYFRAIFIVPI